jgi:hypothetical protein
MDEVLTIEEMKVRYAPEWVLIGDPETDEALRFLGAIPEDLVLVL